MKETISYRELIDIQRDIERQCMQSPAFEFFHRAKITAFWKQNKQRLSIAQEAMHSFQEVHIKKDEHGSYMRIKKEGEVDVWDFKSEEDEKQYKEKLGDFLAKNLEVFL